MCPVIIDLSSPDSVDDFRTEAVAVSTQVSDNQWVQHKKGYGISCLIKSGCGAR